MLTKVSICESNSWFLFTPSTNLAAPMQSLKIVATGAVLSSLPAWMFFILVLFVSSCLMLQAGNVLGAIALFLLLPFVIALFLALLPVFAIIEVIAACVSRIKKLLRRDAEEEKKSRWWEPLKTNSPLVYALLVLSSIVINIGNWLFFASYLTLEGDMFCPSSLNEITAVWILVPLAFDLVYYLFMFVTQDTSSF
jgi:hypothetical protein